MIIAFKVKKIDENLSSILEKINYGTGSLINKELDNGIDGIIDEDELGLSKIYIQAKRYKDGSNKVGKRYSSSSALSQIKIPKKASLLQRQNLQKRLNVCQR